MATKYAINTGALTWTGSSWNTASNQSTSNTVAPTTADTAVLDQYSSNMTINTTGCTCAVLTMTGYTNTLTFGAGNTLLLNSAGPSTLAGTLAGTGTLSTKGTTVNGTGLGTNTVALYIGGNATINTDGTTWGSFSIGTGYTCTLGSNFQCTGDFGVRTNTAGIIAGAYDITCGSLTLQNKCTLTLVANRTLTTGAIYISGVQGFATTLKSSSASTNTNINFTGSEDNSVMFGATLTDINFTSPRRMYTWYGTVTRGAGCSVIQNYSIRNTNLLLK
jgi:hypothetical protein